MYEFSHFTALRIFQATEPSNVDMFEISKTSSAVFVLTDYGVVPCNRCWPLRLTSKRISYAMVPPAARSFSKFDRRVDLLPLAREAHRKVEFKKVKKGDFHGEAVAEGEVVPKPNDEISYEDWAGERTKEQMHKAGWRLAFLIETLLH